MREQSFSKIVWSFMLLVVSVTNSAFVNSPPKGKTWALLVAGSNGYSNYRHQADVCHAYQLLKERGLPEKNIIVMMYDDIAYNEENPTKGVIINEPGGKDVYKGVRKDYTGENVTVANFLHILAGDKEAVKNVGSGRVIESGPGDFIYVNFVDHGAPGVLIFPDEELHAADLHKTLDKMVEEKKFKKIIMYIEACFSGSMFDNILEDDSNIFVMTAADPRESSYACYYDEKRQTYLGDLFSVNWMIEAEKEQLERSSLNHLFEKVRTKTEKSHVEEYGDLDIGSTNLSTFLESPGRKKLDFGPRRGLIVNPNLDAVESPDVPLEILKRKLLSEKLSEKRKKIEAEIDLLLFKRQKADKMLEKILYEATGYNRTAVNLLQDSRYPITRRTMHCSKELIRFFSNKCLKISQNPYIANKLHQISNLCSTNYINSVEAFGAIEKNCEYSEKITGVL